MQDSNAVEVNTDNQGLLLLNLFPGKELSFGEDLIFQIKGELTLDNGKTLTFDTKGSANKPYVVDTASSSSSPSGTEPTDPITMAGVNRLGIGVYRKVEQEVCCYVPGEVSRIENILAREYKERHTRSLLSTETTEEDTTEIEVENQSDTVATTRYELQTEVANELSKDTSIGVGASVGVSGSYAGVTVSADGYFDYATSNASSSSDSEAKTYAQELTNNALERILQKTTQKRTSKILEEYEENNRHGFDNREGTQHVTGVYRWIDIIYTNRLINYGKRLMIEFLMPEPARFYKMALTKRAESESESSSSSELEAPVPLTDHGINSASDIDEDNYLELGRAYGVTLDDPVIPAEDTITKTFGPSDDPSGDSDPDAKERSYNMDFNFLESGDYSLYATVLITTIPLWNTVHILS